MIHWSLLSEYFALILIIVIMLFFYDKRRIRSFRRQLFWNCLWLSVASILLNIASVFFIENVGRFPVGTAMLMNSAYFMVSILMCTAIAFYLFQYIFEYVYDKNGMRRIMVGLALLVFVNFVLVLWNAYSGMIFYIDSAGNYCRGPLNAVGFATPIAEVIVFLIFYIRYRNRTGRAIARMVWTIPPIVVLLVVYQMAYPDQLLNGALCALSDLIIFINYVREIMTDLSRRKVNFLLDDFGTGYSNFSSVLDLPFEAIKLDRSLTAGLADSPQSKLMADTIIPFFHELGDRVVAEGIETQRQAELALNCGADRLQGFLFARPMPEREFLDWLSAHGKRDGKKDFLSD